MTAHAGGSSCCRRHCMGCGVCAQANTREIATLALQSPRSSPAKHASLSSSNTEEVIRMSQDVTLLAEQMKTQRKTLTSQITELEQAHVRVLVHV